MKAYFSFTSVDGLSGTKDAVICFAASSVGITNELVYGEHLLWFFHQKKLCVSLSVFCFKFMQEFPAEYVLLTRGITD